MFGKFLKLRICIPIIRVNNNIRTFDLINSQNGPLLNLKFLSLFLKFNENLNNENIQNLDKINLTNKHDSNIFLDDAKNNIENNIENNIRNIYPVDKYFFDNNKLLMDKNNKMKLSMIHIPFIESLLYDGEESNLLISLEYLNSIMNILVRDYKHIIIRILRPENIFACTGYIIKYCGNNYIKNWCNYDTIKFDDNDIFLDIKNILDEGWNYSIIKYFDNLMGHIVVEEYSRKY